MPAGRESRRLAAILAMDVVGYSRMVEADESGTLAQLRALRSEVAEPALAGHAGRIVKHMGDGLLAEFASVVDAVSCAVAMQRAMAGRGMAIRIGINLGDVVVDGDDLLGDGVNIAARLEGIAAPGGVVISGSTYDQLKGKTALTCDDLGPQRLKNIAEPVRAYRVRIDGEGAATPRPAPARRPPSWRLPAVAAALALAALVVGIFLWLPWSASPPPPARQAAAPAPAPVPAREPVIAVLAFDNLSGDPEQEYFSDGLSEDIITALARFPSLRVIGRNTSFQYKGKSQDLARIGRELNAAFILQGSVRRDSGRIRATAQLVRTSDGTQLWAERYDRPLADVFALQDELAQRVVGSVVARVVTAEAVAAAAKPPADLGVYDLTLLGRAARVRGGKESNARARELLERAAALDPNYAPAQVWLSQVYNTFLVNPYSDEFGTSAMAERIAATAARAVSLAPDWALAQAAYADSLTTLGRFDEALAGAERALAQGANDSDVLVRAANVFYRSGDYARSLQALDRMAELDPARRATAPVSQQVAWDRFFLGSYQAALAEADACLARDPGYPLCAIARVASLVQLGRIEEARAGGQAFLRANPDYTVARDLAGRRQRFRNAADVERLAEALRAAGLPE